jgi:hypothetical protein
MSECVRHVSTSIRRYVLMKFSEIGNGYLVDSVEYLRHYILLSFQYSTWTKYPKTFSPSRQAEGLVSCSQLPTTGFCAAIDETLFLSYPALWSTQPPVKWSREFVDGGKAPGV